ncbi:heat-inducible transcriptional repressor HrcA [Acidicapsa ligni]|uniref:heat-inducible transcriptional repressor HrcA n=1 Tax=Acidicapsa ligni TaxID=542300 RepID=UPI0021DFF76B|nr:heat-inducible transcriptional repressor HrcA [Acidicapsa ligni]
MNEYRISPRERMVLTAIIEIYIATGEPVSSQAVARYFDNKDGLSSATIRNVMALLDETGMLDQPHTSAGRLPTPKAFRYHVEQLQQSARAGVAATNVQLSQISDYRREQIEDSFTGVTSSQQYLERTSHVLALISSGLGVALASSTVQQVLEHIHFSRLATGRVLAVLVTKAGTVQDRVLTIDRELSYDDLEISARYLNENFRGWPLDKIRVEVARRIDAERAEYDMRLRSLDELCRQGALAAEFAGPTIYVEGMANLLAGELDRERLRQMLVALDAKQRLVELLNAYVDSRQHEVRVVVGLDEAMPAMQDLVLIGAPARFGAESMGTVAVIAPTRMQYQEIMQAVSYIAGLSERVLEAPPQ